MFRSSFMIKLFSSFFLFLFCSLAVHAEDFYIKNYTVHVTIHRDSTLDVDEDIFVHFTSYRHGIYRMIPYKYVWVGKELPEGLPFFSRRIKFLIYDIQIPGYKWKSSKSWNKLELRIGSPDELVNGDHEYKIHYKVYHEINFFKNRSEFYWNLIGTEWAVPIQKAAFEINLPENLSLNKNDYFVYTGVRGAKGRKAVFQFDGKRLFGETISQLDPYEGLTAGIRFPQGYLSRGSFSLENRYFLVNYGLFIPPVLIFAVLFVIWWLYGKDDPIVDMPFYHPPPNLTPAETGLLMHLSPQNSDIISLIYWWAANGFIQIKEVPATNGGEKDQLFAKLKDLPENAHEFEKILFYSIFFDESKLPKLSFLEKKSFLPTKEENSKSSEISFNSIKPQLTWSVAKAKNELDQCIVKENLFIGWTRTFGRALIGLGILTVVAGPALLIFTQEIDYLLSGAATCAVLIIFGYAMPKKTPEGLKDYQAVRGFKEFMKRAEKSKLEALLREDPNYFDKTLPYAVALGVLKVWGDKFKDLISQPPGWYQGSTTGSFSTGDFAASLDSSVSSMSAAFSPSGGDSGGGSSGGGGGGGGGGSW